MATSSNGNGHGAITVQPKLDRRTEVVFRNLGYTIPVKDPKSRKMIDKEILKDVTGTFLPGRLTAVMGASGAGKTSLLNLVAGHFSIGKMTGEVLVNGEPCSHDRLQRMSGFVHQDDVIMDTMTVREAIHFSATLRLPESMPASQKNDRVNEIITLLRLNKVQDSIIGSAMIKGISGGEKRRVSVGMEMVTNPSLLFLDEPTTGLDTFNAFSIIQLLRRVAHTHNRTIVCTIHQPSSEVFHLFDDLVLMAEGQTMYHGPANQVVSYFSSLKYVCPDFVNPADFLFTHVLYILKNNVEYMGTNQAMDAALNERQKEMYAKQQASESKRIHLLLQDWKESRERNEMMSMKINNPQKGYLPTDNELKSNSSGFWTQFKLLYMRTARNQSRNKMLARAQFSQNTFMAIIVGLIYLRIGHDQSSVQDRSGSLFFLAVNPFMGNCMANLAGFGGERAVFIREYRSKMYGLTPYFFSRLAMMLPLGIFFPFLFAAIAYFLIGYQEDAAKFFLLAATIVEISNVGMLFGIFICCAIPDIAIALAVGPMFLMPLMVFSGFYVNLDSIGPWFAWIQYLSPIKYGFIALFKNEYEGLSLVCTPGQTCRYPTGDSVITGFGFQDKQTIGENMLILFAFWVGLIGLSISMLHRTALKA